ncbi:MAG: hypothetical protein JETCAE03_32280 [Ignavibacteriaceae bacterium]|nr:MAG: hypothetical protein JETCAE03_32280 [Ignavibacteriaceae bacterium]
MKYYRIVEVDDKGNYKTLFHANKGSRILETGKWLKSVQKLVRDGSRKKAKQYLSGWHIIPGEKEVTERFMNSFFKAPRMLKIVEVKIRGKRWPKSHSRHNILLCEEMKIL